MNIPSSRLRRSALTVIGAVAPAALLTGCNQLTLEEAQAAPHRVVETGHDFWEGESWSYIGPDGRESALTEDCSEPWNGYCWTDLDGLIEFRYNKSKSSVVSARMIFDGSEWPMECHLTDFWNGEYVCAVI